MKKSVSAIAVLLLLCVFLSSCSSGMVLRSVNELIAPPLYYSEYEELVEAFKSDIGNNISLCTPYDGDYCSAITVEDIDSDGADEALIFYKNNSSDSVPKIRICDSSNSNWVTADDIDGYGSTVDSLRIYDLDGDGIKELIVNWSLSGSTGKTMSVYRCENGKLTYKEITNELSFASCVVDMDDDGKEEILFIGQSAVSGTMQRFIKLIKISDGSVVIMDEANTDANVSGYADVKTEKVSENSPMKVYFDAYKGESQMITELVYWDRQTSSLAVPFFDEDTMTTYKTLRNEPIECFDINNDGSIEIPVQEYLPENEAVSIDSEKMPLTSWIDFDDGEIKYICNSFINTDDGYVITVTDDELSTLEARRYPSQKCIIVSDGDGDLYSIKRVENSEKNSENFKNYIQLLTRDDFTVCAYITQNGEKAGINGKLLEQKIIQLT